MPMMPPAQLMQVFQHGPVLLVLDADGAGHHGLPARAAGHCVIAPLVAAEHRDALMADAATLTIAYSDELTDGHATVATAQALALIGRNANGTPAVVLNPSKLAERGELLPLLVHQVLAALRLAPPAPIWSFPTEPAELADARARAVPNKARALDLARAGQRPVWLGLRVEAAGLHVLAIPPGADVHNLLLMPDTLELSLGEAGIGWQQADPTGTVQAMFVPWPALWGLRSADHAVGFVWLADAPRSVRATVAASAEALADLSDIEGAPMPPPPALPPALLLAPPRSLSGEQALRWCLQQGPTLVIVDAANGRVRAPAGLRDLPAIAFAHPIGMSTSVVYDEVGLVANMPDANGAPATLRAPWDAVVAVQSLAPMIAASWSWAEHVSPTLQSAMHVGADGHWALTLEQPCGPETAQGRAALQVEVKVERFEIN
jgi:hypothetical protein